MTTIRATCPRCHLSLPASASDLAGNSAYCECKQPSWGERDNRKLLEAFAAWWNSMYFPPIGSRDIDRFLATRNAAAVRGGNERTQR
jgi:hypothetical protein